MRLTGLILVPLLSSCPAVGANVAWAAEAHPGKAATPDASSNDLSSRRPTQQTSGVPASVNSRIPATPTRGSAYVVENHRPAVEQGQSQLPPQLLNTPPPKHATSQLRFG